MNQPIERIETGQAFSGDSRIAAAFLAHRERLWRLVHFRLDAGLRGRVDAEDVLQEAFLAAKQREQHFPEDGSDYIWLRLVVLQTLADVHRRHVAAQRRSTRRETHGPPRDRQAASTDSIVGQLLGHLTSPSQAAIRQELGEQLRAAIAEMGELDAEVLALRHFEELTNLEVATVLGITEKAASIRYVRALQRLKSILERIPSLKT